MPALPEPGRPASWCSMGSWESPAASRVSTASHRVMTNTAMPAGGAHPCDPEAHLPHLQQDVEKFRASVNSRACWWVCVCLTQMGILFIFVPTSLNVEEGGSEHISFEARKSRCRVHPCG